MRIKRVLSYYLQRWCSRRRCQAVLAIAGGKRADFWQRFFSSTWKKDEMVATIRSTANCSGTIKDRLMDGCFDCKPTGPFLGAKGASFTIFVLVLGTYLVPVFFVRFYYFRKKIYPGIHHGSPAALERRKIIRFSLRRWMRNEVRWIPTAFHHFYCDFQIVFFSKIFLLNSIAIVVTLTHIFTTCLNPSLSLSNRHALILVLKGKILYYLNNIFLKYTFKIVWMPQKIRRVGGGGGAR